MKTKFLMALAACTIAISTIAQEINFENPTSINQTGVVPHQSAILDVQAANKGILIPRLTASARNAITSPATGLMIYQTDVIPGFYYFNGITWKPVWQDPSGSGGGSGSSLWDETSGNIYRSVGKVGICTTTPTASLHLKQAYNNVSHGIRLETSLPTNEDWYIFMDDNDDLVIRNDADPMFIMKKNNGQVALGDLFATGYRLSVDGKIAAEEILIDYADYWPDYVFDDSYDLMPIDELAESIEKNNHLPGIPSAKEVESEGFLVGEMQKLTMEKIEELSLYIIELHERIKTLEAQLDK